MRYSNPHMATAHTTWTVFRHQPIAKLADNLWVVRGELPEMPIGRSMVVVRMHDSRLVIHNPIALEEVLMNELEEWGTPAFIVVPNGWHRLDCAVFKQRYPEAKIVAPAGSRKKVEEVVPVELTCGEFPEDQAVAFEHITGVREVEAVMHVRSKEGVTLVFNDLVFNLAHQPGFTGWMFRLLGSTGGPKVTRVMRLLAVKDKRATREHLKRLAQTPGLVRIIPGHGEVIASDAATILHGIAHTL